MHIVMVHTLPWWMCVHSDDAYIMFTETYTSRNQLHCVHVQSRNILYEKVGGK